MLPFASSASLLTIQSQTSRWLISEYGPLAAHATCCVAFEIPMGSPAVPEEKPNDEDDENKPSDATAHLRSAIVITTSSAKEKQQNQNDQNGTHRAESISWTDSRSYPERYNTRKKAIRSVFSDGAN